jgi:hypothetical protein
MDLDSARHLLVALGQHRIRVCAHLAQTDEVRVRIEHHQAQVRLDQQPLAITPSE